MQPDVLVSVSLRYTVDSEGGRYYATCHFMGVVGQGNSEAEAIKAMKEEVDVLFDVCSEQGILASVLIERSSRYSPPVTVYRDMRIESIRALDAEAKPEWTSIDIDPAIIDSVLHGDYKAGES